MFTVRSPHAIARILKRNVVEFSCSNLKWLFSPLRSFRAIHFPRLNNHPKTLSTRASAVLSSPAGQRAPVTMAENHWGLHGRTGEVVLVYRFFSPPPPPNHRSRGPDAVRKKLLVSHTIGTPIETGREKCFLRSPQR